MQYKLFMVTETKDFSFSAQLSVISGDKWVPEGNIVEGVIMVKQGVLSA